MELAFKVGASLASEAILSLIRYKASITVLPVTQIRFCGTFSATKFAFEVSVGAK